MAKARRAKLHTIRTLDSAAAETITPCCVHIQSNNRESSFDAEGRVGNLIYKCVQSLSFGNHR
eukprot:6821962-Pyramimonas_sp.AAC.1